MTNTADASYPSFIESVLQEAAELARSYFGKVTGTVKAGDNNQVLTEADLAVGKLIVERIQAVYPDYNIIDEEAGVIDNKSEYTWVVDPIDGTSNFAAGVPTYGILLGLLKGRTPLAGGMALPSLGELYIAAKGRGAFCNGERVKVTEERQLQNALVAYGIDGHTEDPSITYEETGQLSDIILAVRNYRSSNCCFDIAQVAKGCYGASLNRTSKIWDNIAQHIVIEEAGGIYTDFWGKPMDYSDPLGKVAANFTWCAAAPQFHGALQEIIAVPPQM